MGAIFELKNDDMIEYEMLPECPLSGFFCVLLYEGTMVESVVGLVFRRPLGEIPLPFFFFFFFFFFFVYSGCTPKPIWSNPMAHADLDWTVLLKTF